MRHELPRLAGMAGAAVVRTAIRSTYARRRGDDPPLNPSHEGVRWRDAILWTAVLAAGAGVGQLVVRYVVGESVGRMRQRRSSA